ncbi:hypothetical protein GIB67_021607 [Kingdonia uniflora]|uniref:Uncharacterized protein n=1 Tax=Kingdonia uniflora TaxID=39325 RepID=A0A7J7MDW7_9MAGN|nr:hypothetical protein GIB67_021607 [Kingdonia uniflora]
MGEKFSVAHSFPSYLGFQWMPPTNFEVEPWKEEYCVDLDSPNKVDYGDEEGEDWLEREALANLVAITKMKMKRKSIKGVYSSQTIEDAANFLFHFSGHLCMRERVAFLCRLASVAKEESFGRSGLMALSVCIASSAGGRSQMCKVALDDMVQMGSTGKSFHPNSKSDLLDILRLLIESSKQHFNQNYRLRVCEKVVEAAASVMCASDVPLETLMHFFATMPREFTDYRGRWRMDVMWNTKEQTTCKWIKPQEGIFALDTDGSLTATGGYGAILRDYLCIPIIACTGRGAAKSVIIHELQAIYHGHQLALKFIITKRKVNCDCKCSCNYFETVPT